MKELADRLIALNEEGIALDQYIDFYSRVRDWLRSEISNYSLPALNITGLLFEAMLDGKTESECVDLMYFYVNALFLGQAAIRDPGSWTKGSCLFFLNTISKKIGVKNDHAAARKIVAGRFPDSPLLEYLE
ncbi:MAG: hypothetical protein ABIH69_07785 [bacterium]|nr:hypothetical protein [Candidatus Margulisiibacteriota bacterium]